MEHPTIDMNIWGIPKQFPEEKYSVLQLFPKSGFPVFLTKVIVPQKVKVEFISWNPLSPPPIPPSASILWLECSELASTSPNQRNAFGNNNHIASWPLAGSVFDGTQTAIQLHGLVTPKLTFSLWTNLGEVPIIEANQLIVSLTFNC